jgi:hypothetical protein
MSKRRSDTRGARSRLRSSSSAEVSWSSPFSLGVVLDELLRNVEHRGLEHVESEGGSPAPFTVVRFAAPKFSAPRFAAP